jgi:hypothetical protein
VDGFKSALTVEANAAGYEITENMSMAKYSIKFSVDFDRIEQKSKFIVSLIKIEDSSEIVSMEYLFADEEEMLLYTQLVFFMLASNIPENETAGSELVNDNWRNKWLYINPSFNYSLMFLALKSDGLIGGIGAYNDSSGAPTMVSPLDNKVIPVMGIGLGLEFQFLNFMSIEPGAQISREEIVLDHLMYNLLLSVKLKIPLKFLRSIVFAPYGAAAYPWMRFPEGLEVFNNYPMYIYGGGIQIAVKAGNNGALFFDVNYMIYGDTGIKNQLGELYPKPEVINYSHSVLGFGVGYKFGFFNRKR